MWLKSSGKFAEDVSRMTLYPNGPHDIELQIGGSGRPRSGVHVLRRHPRLCYGYSLQLGLHCERCGLKRQLKPPAQWNCQQRRRTRPKSPPASLPHIPKYKSAPRAVACEADSGLLTALGRCEQTKISCFPWYQSSFHRTICERRKPKPGRTQLPATLPALDSARSASPPAPQQAIQTRS
jgi:hypothetical protein